MSRLAAELPRAGVILFMTILASGRLKPRSHYRVGAAAESNRADFGERNPALTKARAAPEVARRARLRPGVSIHGEGAVSRAGVDAAASCRLPGGAERGQERQEKLLARAGAGGGGGPGRVVEQNLRFACLHGRRH